MIVSSKLESLAIRLLASPKTLGLLTSKVAIVMMLKKVTLPFQIGVRSNGAGETSQMVSR